MKGLNQDIVQELKGRYRSEEIYFLFVYLKKFVTSIQHGGARMESDSRE